MGGDDNNENDKSGDLTEPEDTDGKEVISPRDEDSIVVPERSGKD